MQPVTTQASTTLTTANNQTGTTTLYPNDVTWESVGRYAHLFNQCWEYIPTKYAGRGSEPESCGFKSDKVVMHQDINYPCIALKADFSIYVEKVQKLSDYICPRYKYDIVKDFDAKVNVYERYDDVNYLNKLLIAGTSISIVTVGISLIAAGFIAFEKLDTEATEGVSCTTKYWLPLTLVASSIVPVITGSITAAAWANDGLPSDGKDCIEYHLLQDMGQLAHTVTGVDYL